jgi:hypothetical protein
MKLLVQGVGWGVVIEADYEAARWLREFVRTKRILPSEEHIAVQLYEQLSEVLDG